MREVLLLGRYFDTCGFWLVLWCKRLTFRPFLFRFRCVLGVAPLAAVFPDVTKDVHGEVAKHTTAVGAVPDQISGSRFVINLRVPPRPKGLTDQDDNDPEYDESAEKWQYMRLEVKDAFEYRVRLPRGLQHHRVPEIQVYPKIKWL